MSLPPNSWTENIIEDQVTQETNLVEWEIGSFDPEGFCGYPAAGAFNPNKIF